MFSTESGIPFAIVNGGKGDGTIVRLDIENTGFGHSHTSVKFPGKFEPFPSDKVRVIYVAGPAGSGKSYYVSMYLINVMLYTENPNIILFSQIRNDESFQGVKFNQVIDLKNPELKEEFYNIDDVTDGSILVFDDIDTLSDMKLQKALYNFIGQCLELGRHMNIKCLITSHLINGNDRKFTRTVLNEMQSLTFFPSSGSRKAIDLVLGTYIGLDKKQIREIMETESRWVTIFKNYPQFLMTENNAMFIRDLH